MVAGGSGGPGGRFEVEEAGRLGQLEVAQDLFVAGGEFGALAADAGRAGEGAEVEPFELVAEVAPGFAGGVLGDADEEQGEPAEQDVGADPVFLAVVDGAQLEARLQVAPGALDLEQLLVAEATSSAERVGSDVRRRNLPSRRSSARTAARSIRSSPAFVWRR